MENYNEHVEYQAELDKGRRGAEEVGGEVRTSGGADCRLDGEDIIGKMVAERDHRDHWRHDCER